MCGTAWPDTTTTVCQVCADHEAKQAARIAAAAEAARALSKNLVRIFRVELRDKNNTPWWQFTGEFENGTTQVLRAKATRAYTIAAIHQYTVVSKFDGFDPRAFITFHQSSPKPAGKWDVIIRTLPIIAPHEHKPEA
jgi:hypothetical protein